MNSTNMISKRPTFHSAFTSPSLPGKTMDLSSIFRTAHASFDRSSQPFSRKRESSSTAELMPLPKRHNHGFRAERPPMPKPRILSTERSGEFTMTITDPELRTMIGLKETDPEALIINKIGLGDTWYVYAIPSTPFVLKVVNPLLSEDKKIARAKYTLKGLEEFPENAHVSLAPSPVSVEKAINVFKRTGIFIQYRVSPIQEFSPTHPLFPNVRDALAQMLLEDRFFIEDFRPRNVGVYEGKFVDFDPVYLPKCTKDCTQIVEYYLEWAGGEKKHGGVWMNINKDLLRALITPLEEALQPTEKSKGVLANLLPYCT